MARTKTQCEALTVGQLSRWGVSAERVRHLIASGQLPGAFVIPAAGRYGQTVKVPLATVVQAETEDWAIIPKTDKAGAKPRRPRGDSAPALKHFPKLAASPGPASGSLAD